MRVLKTEELDLVAGGNDPQEGNDPRPPLSVIDLAATLDLDPQEGNGGNP